MIPDELREIFDEFLVEANEHIENLESKLLELEKDPNNEELINAAFRSMHTLKGGAGFLGLTAIVEVAHRAEDILGRLKERKLTVNKEILDILLKAVDFIREALKFYEDDEEVTVPEDLIAKLSSVLEGSSLESLLDKYGFSHLKGKSIEDILEELVLLPPNKRPQEIIDFIDSMLSGQEEQQEYTGIMQKIDEEATNKMLEMVEEEIGAEEQTASIKEHESRTEKSEINTTTKKEKEEEKVLRIDINKIETLMNLVGELVLDRNRL